MEEFIGLARGITRNYVIYYLSDLLMRVFNVGLVVFVAHKISLEQFGNFSFGLTILAITLTITDFGLVNVLTREIARLSHSGQSYARLFHVAWFLRFIFITCGVVLVYTYVPLATNDVKVFMALGGVALAIKSFAEITSSVLRATNRFLYDSMMNIGYTCCYVVLSVCALYKGVGLPGIALAMVIAGSAQTVAAWCIVRRGEQVVWQAWVWKDNVLTVQLLKAALPFGVLAVFSVVYVRQGTVMLQYLCGASVVGLYQAAGKIIEAVTMIPGAIAVALYPVFSAYASCRGRDTSNMLVMACVKYLSFIGIPFTISIVWASPAIITLLYPTHTFAGAVPILQVLMFMAAAVFISTITSTFINAMNAAHVNALIAACMVGINLCLNVVLIPRYGPIGAAIAAVITEFSGIAMNTVYIRRCWFPLNYRMVMRGIIAGGVMAVVLYGMPGVPAVARVTIACLAYGAMLYFLRAITREDVIMLRKLWQPA
jgi:O-antigen/teichoic acid export membrane protein